MATGTVYVNCCGSANGSITCAYSDMASKKRKRGVGMPSRIEDGVERNGRIVFVNIGSSKNHIF
jgi:hypothetical protein